MNLNKNIVNEIITIAGNDNVKLNEPMKNHTSFKVGGPADMMVFPNSYESTKKVIDFCKAKNVNYFILGNGSNLLVKDGGIRGVVIKFAKLNEIFVEEDKMIVQSGARLCDVAKHALKNGLRGFEFASGIPGSIGGATAMNAGAYDGEMSKVVHSVLVINDKGELITLSKEEMEFEYRISAILKYNYVVLEVTLQLEQGDKTVIGGRIDELTKKRSDRQPLEYASAGSTFKRPEGYFAGKLIQDAGLKGVHVGDAEVSEKHSGFIINKGNATSKDLLDLIELVKARVYEKFQVELHTEVRIVGEDS